MSIDNRQISVKSRFPLNGKILGDVGSIELSKLASATNMIKGEFGRDNLGRLIYKAEDGTIVIIVDTNGVIPAGSVGGIAGVSMLNGLTGNITLSLNDLHDVNPNEPPDGSTLVYNSLFHVWDYSVSNPGDKNHEHVQVTPSNLWIVNHNLNKIPSTSLFINNHIAYTDIEILPSSDPYYLKRIYVRFLKAQSGYLICN